MNPRIVVLGIDPGLANLGWGVVVVERSRIIHHSHGVIRSTFGREEPTNVDLQKRVTLLAGRLERLLNDVNPDVAAMESFQFYGKNVTSGLQLGNVTGMIREQLRLHGINVSEHSAQQVKRAVAGSWSADKRSVQLAVQRQLDLDALPTPNHAADALAVALTKALALPVEFAVARAKEVAQ